MSWDSCGHPGLWIMMYIVLFCHRKNMELVYVGSQIAKPKANIALDKNAQLLVYQWLKSLCLPDGHASNISRLVSLEDCKLYRMKSHDYHVFIETLIPLGYHDLLSKEIWDVLTKISHLIRDICSNKLQTQHMERLENNIIQTICKLEMIFPLSFSTRWSIYLYIYYLRQKLGALSIQEVGFYTCIVIKILLSFFAYFKTFI